MTPTKPQITPMTCSTWFDPIRWLQDLRSLRQLTGVPVVSFGRVCTSSHFCKRGGKFLKLSCLCDSVNVVFGRWAH